MQDTSWLSKKDDVQETNQPQADQWRGLVIALENCEEQLRRVRVVAELKRTGPREGLDRLKFNQLEIEREIETIRVLASSCALSWSNFDSDNIVHRDDLRPAQPSRPISQEG